MYNKTELKDAVETDYDYDWHRDIFWDAVRCVLDWTSGVFLSKYSTWQGNKSRECCIQYGRIRLGVCTESVQKLRRRIFTPTLSRQSNVLTPGACTKHTGILQKISDTVVFLELLRQVLDDEEEILQMIYASMMKISLVLIIAICHIMWVAIAVDYSLHRSKSSALGLFSSR